MSKNALKRWGFALLLAGISFGIGSNFTFPRWFTIIYPTLAVIWLIAWDDLQARRRGRE